MPSAINALAFSQPIKIPQRFRSSSNATSGNNLNGGKVLLACARANGDIEIWNPFRWHMERMIPGNPDATIESIVWVQTPQDSGNDQTAEDEDDEMDDDDLETKAAKESSKKTSTATKSKASSSSEPRLMTAGLDGFITEWDLISLSPLNKVESGGGAIWCMAVSPKGDELAVGCEDGCVRVFKVGNKVGDPVEYKKTFDRQDDSCIRIYSSQSKRCVSRMTVDTKAREDTLVWAVSYLADGTLVSGDSLGAVSFWDPDSKTMNKTLKSHAADVLCLAVGRDGDVVYSSGIDRKVIQYRLVDTTTGGQRKKQQQHAKVGKTWIVSGERRYHSHDVRAIALCEAKPIDAIVTGGVDTTLTASLNVVSEFPSGKLIRHSPFPQRTIVSLAPVARMVLARFADSVKVWRLGDAMPDEVMVDNSMRDGERIRMAKKERLIAEIKIDCVTNLMSSAISADGEFIAVSDLYQTRLFRLMHHQNFPSPSIIPGTTALAFTPDCRRLVLAGTDSIVRVLDLSGVIDDPKRGDVDIVMAFRTHCGKGSGGNLGDGDDDEVVGDDDEDVDMMEYDESVEQKTRKLLKNRQGREL
ncbi:U3 small nucleolar RNA-associated protein, partial [Blyttiomyces sp. JEL0837]